MGGKVTANIQRKKALDIYNENPNYCLNCNQKIEVKDVEKISNVRRKKFCNHSCSATHNNKGVNRGSGVGACKNCGNVVIFIKVNNRYRKRQYCDECVFIIKVKNRNGTEPISNRTKGDLFANRKH